MSRLPFDRHCLRSTERGCHVACVLIGTNFSLRYVATGIDWNCNAAYSVLESTPNNSDLPYIYNYRGTHMMCDNWNELLHLACATV